jgi:hypothetical protein
MKTSDKLFAAYNMLFHVFSERGKSTEFVKNNLRFGFNADNTANLLLSESISMLLRSMELFKNCFMFVLRFENGFWSKMTLGKLIGGLISKTDNKFEIVSNEIDVVLRNALTHGLFWLQGSVLIYYEDLTLQREHEIIISELWTKGRKHSLIAQCLFHVIPDWFSGT